MAPARVPAALAGATRWRRGRLGGARAARRGRRPPGSRGARPAPRGAGVHPRASRVALGRAARLALGRRPPVRAAAPRPDPPSAVVARLELRTPEGTPNPVARGRPPDGGRRPALGARAARDPAQRLRGLGPAHGARRLQRGAHAARRRRPPPRSDALPRGRTVLRVPVALGAPGWETPRGRFYVRNRLSRYRSPAYGPVAFGTSARSPAATGWPAGGYVGIQARTGPT